MPGRSVESLKKLLWEESDPLKVCDGTNRLAKVAAQGDPAAIDALVEYLDRGSISHARTHVMAMLAGLPTSYISHLAERFAVELRQKATRYWAIKGVAATMGPAGYPLLVQLAKSEKLSAEERAHAIKCLAQASGQPFDRGLPKDPGFWKAQDLRVREVVAWEAAGFPKGPGYSAPPRDPALDHPHTPLEKCAARLESRLAKLRGDSPDLAAPADWLTPAQPKDLAIIEKRYQLPALYREFLTRFSPMSVTIPRGPWEIALFGAADLIRGQDGYSFNPITQEVIFDWKDDHLVIASRGGDPFVLDLSASSGNDAPVLTARHGVGAWKFKKSHASFLAFLESLA